MNRQQAQKLLASLPLIQALAEGKTIQYNAGDKHGWIDTSNPSFFEHCQYRVKPEPKELWLVLGEIEGYLYRHVEFSKAQADRALSQAQKFNPKTLFTIEKYVQQL